MSLIRPRRALLVPLGFSALLLLSACSRLLPMRRAVARSGDLVIDSRQAPAPALTGCFIPETFPAISKVPVAFLGVPPNATFTDSSVEVLLKNETGDPLALLKTVIENNHVYLEFAVPKRDAFTQVVVAVHGTYRYR